MRRRGSGSGAQGDRGRGRERQAGDRDDAACRGEGRGRAPARGCRRVRTPRGGRSAAGRAGVTTLAVGVMSGTSLDGVSTALVRLSEQPLDAQLVAFLQDAYTAPERGQIIEAIARGGSRDLALLHVALGERFAGAVLQLLAQAKVAPRDLSFIASHGQTIWHEPCRATLQLGDPAVIAERVGVRVVSDFRSRDVAAGGQGAPLVPLADVVLFGHLECGRLLLTIGGIANVTFAPRRGVTGGALAFDTGPGVAVVDAVTRRIDPAARFDAGGERARRGKPSPKVLEALLADPYFAAPPPKSTGRERFGPDYAARLLDDVKRAGGSDNDAVATATALTVETIARGVERWTPARPSDELDLGRRRAQSTTGRAPHDPRGPATRGAVRGPVFRRRSQGGSGVRLPRFSHAARGAGQPAGRHRRSRPARARPHHSGVTGSLARLVFPALRWRRESFGHERPKIDAALAAGVGGFIVFGGTRYAVLTLTRELRAQAGRPLLVGAD